MWETLIINPMLNSLLWIYSILGDFGLAIILFTILVRLVTHPLTVQQIKGQQRMQEFQQSKEWAEVQKKYKDDKQKLQQAQMELYKELKINPFASCLPLLIQFPVIIGLYQSITRALASTPLALQGLYHNLYAFIDVSRLLPVDNIFLWMNLSQPERLKIPGISFGIPVLAVLVLVTTYLQSKLMTPVAQPGDQSAQMSQMMNLYMPLLMGYLALTFASGLALYFVTTNVVSIMQYAILGKVNWRNLLPNQKQVVASAPVKSEKKSPAGPSMKSEGKRK